MYRARLPKSVFREILRDIRVLGMQYGLLELHPNEEARSRFLSGYFNAVVDQFSGLLINRQESTLESRRKANASIEYHFQTYGGVTVVFIDVKVVHGGEAEHLNCYAQVIAECDACTWMNLENGFDVPLMAELCDGHDFRLFKFEGPQQAGALPQFFLAVFLRQTRLLCEGLYHTFLSGYHVGLAAYWRKSLELSKKLPHISAPQWYQAVVLAKQALDEAKSAWIIRDNKEAFELSAGRALQYLTDRQPLLLCSTNED